MKKPISNSYWVRPGRLAAGEYPGAKDPSDAVPKIRTLLEAGIDYFIDLTHSYELEPYNQIARQEAQRLGKTVSHERLPITDLSIPHRSKEMTKILDAIDRAIDEDSAVYVHCWGGVGRTGTVIGCWLVRHGLTGDEALARVAQLWQGVEKVWRTPNSPETYEQREYVRNWHE